MDRSSIASVARFEAYVEALIGVLGHADRAEPMRDYCTGLLLPMERKSVSSSATTSAPSSPKTDPLPEKSLVLNWKIPR